MQDCQGGAADGVKVTQNAGGSSESTPMAIATASKVSTSPPSSEQELSSSDGDTARRPAPSSHTSRSRRSSSTGTSKYSSSSNAGPLPREVLHLTFSYLHNTHWSYLYRAMDVCQTWRAIIAGGDYWSELVLSLDLLDVVKAAGAFARRIQRCGRFAPMSSLVAKPVLRSLKLHYLDENRLTEALRGELYKDCVSVVQELEPCTSHLTSLSIHVCGDTPAHLGILLHFLRPLAYQDQGDLQTFRNVSQLEIRLPHIRGFRLGNEVMTWFSRLRTLSIVCDLPFTHRKPQQPTQPFISQIISEYMADNKAAVRKYPPREMMLAKQEYFYEKKEFEREQQEYTFHRSQENLEFLWQLLGTPMNQQSKPICTSPDTALTRLSALHLEGCFIMPDLQLPEKGFPSLASVNLTRCKWGRGLWEFLSRCPELEGLAIVDMLRDEEELDDCELIQALRNSREQPVVEASASLNSGKIVMSRKSGTANLQAVSAPSKLPDCLPGPAVTRRPVEVIRPTPQPYRQLPPPAEPNDIIQDLGVGYDDEDEELSDLTDEEFFDDFEEDGFTDEGDMVEDSISWPLEIRIPAGFDESDANIRDEKLPLEEQIKTGFKMQIHGTVRSETGQGFTSFLSMYSWQELRNLRIAHYQRERQRLAGQSVPVTIELPRLNKLDIIGVGSPLIWINMDDDDDRSDPRNTLRRLPNPFIHMPNLQQLNLFSSMSLDRRTVGQLPSHIDSCIPDLSMRSVQKGAKMSREEFAEIIETFEKGKEPVPGEPSDEELFDFMNEEEIEYYTEHMHKLDRYRGEWRQKEGLMGIFTANEKKLWAMVHGLANFRPNPYALTALTCSTTGVTILDLSFTNISRDPFIAALKFLPNLFSLSVAGTRELINSDLSFLPDSCPRLSFLDATAAFRISAVGVAPLFHKIRDGSGGYVRLRVKVDDPALSFWPDSHAVSYRVNAGAYAYLEFQECIVDEELDSWRESQAKGMFFSKSRMKQKMKLKV